MWGPKQRPESWVTYNDLSHLQNLSPSMRVNTHNNKDLSHLQKLLPGMRVNTKYINSTREYFLLL